MRFDKTVNAHSRENIKLDQTTKDQSCEMQTLYPVPSTSNLSSLTYSLESILADLVGKLCYSK